MARGFLKVLFTLWCFHRFQTEGLAEILSNVRKILEISAPKWLNFRNFPKYIFCESGGIWRGSGASDNEIFARNSRCSILPSPSQSDITVGKKGGVCDEDPNGLEILRTNDDEEGR